MRWNCPHCGINLAVSDDKLGPGWAFSRCFKCGGFALVRRSEINLIKVDKAPAGEPVLLPEASETPVLSQEATQNLERYMGGKPANKRVATPARAAVPPAAPNAASAASMLPGASETMSLTQLPELGEPLDGSATQTAVPKFNGYSLNDGAIVPPGLILPSPLPDTPVPAHHRFLPAAIGATGALAIASGIYLFLQGQALWEKARANATTEVRTSRPIRPAAATGNEVVQAPSLVNQNVTPSAGSAIVMDRVHQSSMAPARDPEPAPAHQEGSNVMTPFRVKIRTTNASLHSGPGMQYPITGIANQQLQYLVVDWSDRWFRVTSQASPGQRADSPAWIRNDFVQLDH